MAIDYHIASSTKKEGRFLRHEHRYFAVGEIKIGPFLPLSGDEEKAKAEKEVKVRERGDQETQEKIQKQGQNIQQAQNRLQSPQKTATRPEHELRGDRRETREEREARKKEETSKTQQAQLNDAAAGLTFEKATEQAVQDRFLTLQEREVVTNKSPLAYSLPPSDTPETHESHQAFLHENLGHIFQNPAKENSQGQHKMLGDFKRFIGEGGYLPGKAWGNTKQEERGQRLPQGRPFIPSSPFAGLNTNPLPSAGNQLQVISQMLLESPLPPEAHAKLFTESGVSALFLGKGFLVVKDGDRFRSFRLLDNGDLAEMGEDAHSGKPLSPEARQSMAQVLRERGIRARIQGEEKPLVDHQEGEQQALGKSAKDHSLRARGFKLIHQDESSFTQLLRAALTDGKVIGKALKKGSGADFPEKKDWSGFFGRMLSLGSMEEKGKKEFEEISDLIHRGIFDQEGNPTLVSDLKYKLSGKLKEEKFIRLLIEDPELHEYLKELKPGEKISKELLQEFLGDDLSYTKLIHVLEKSEPLLASEVLRNVKFDYGADHDPYSQARVEHHVLSQSRLSDTPEIVFANVYELQQKEKREAGDKPKLYTFLTYLGVVFAFFLLFFFLTKL